MILSFKPQFVDKILTGEKIHTIRDNPERWTIGKKIHFATGVRTKNYNCFMMGECIGLQSIKIKFPYVHISERKLTPKEVVLLARNDGFNSIVDFWGWFNQEFNGIIIHWTDFLY